MAGLTHVLSLYVIDRHVSEDRWRRVDLYTGETLRRSRARSWGDMTDGMKWRVMVEELPGFEPEIGRLVWMLEETRRRTKESLEGVRADILDWVPGPTANSIGALVYHL